MQCVLMRALHTEKSQAAGAAEKAQCAVCSVQCAVCDQWFEGGGEWKQPKAAIFGQSIITKAESDRLVQYSAYAHLHVAF